MLNLLYMPNFILPAPRFICLDKVERTVFFSRSVLSTAVGMA